MRDALVAINEAKLIRFSKGVSIIYRRANGPSILSNGSSANTIDPLCIP